MSTLDLIIFDNKTTEHNVHTDKITSCSTASKCAYERQCNSARNIGFFLFESLDKMI